MASASLLPPQIRIIRASSEISDSIACRAPAAEVLSSRSLEIASAVSRNTVEVEDKSEASGEYAHRRYLIQVLQAATVLMSKPAGYS